MLTIYSRLKKSQTWLFRCQPFLVGSQPLNSSRWSFDSRQAERNVHLIRVRDCRREHPNSQGCKCCHGSDVEWDENDQPDFPVITFSCATTLFALSETFNTLSRVVSFIFENMQTRQLISLVFLVPSDPLKARRSFILRLLLRVVTFSFLLFLCVRELISNNFDLLVFSAITNKTVRYVRSLQKIFSFYCYGSGSFYFPSHYFLPLE